MILYLRYGKEGVKIELRLLTGQDITERYLEWFRDENVTRFMEAKTITKEEAISNIRTCKNSGCFLYAICVDSVHIGNIKIGPIWRHHGLSDMVTFIGDTDYWGRGYATEAIKIAIGLAFSDNIRKISIGVWSDNIGSLKAYQKAGFEVEAVLSEHYLLDGKTQDKVCLSIWNPAYK